MKTRYLFLALVVGILISVSTTWVVRASDHDDGEVDLKGRNLNLTDLYAFREDWQSGSTDHEGNLILIMNTNPRSVAKQQYYFSTQARYEFHLKRVSEANKTVGYSSGEDVTLRFTFAAPASVSSATQAMTVTAIRDGVSTSTSVTTGGDAILTTPLGSDNTENTITLADSNLSVFAGLKEDPFFFDVEQYFRVRAGIAATNTAAVNFATATTAPTDFTAGYNVNAIVVRVPLAFLKNGNSETAFDVWETISVPQ